MNIVVMTYGNREHVHVEALWVFLQPHVIEYGANTHSKGVVKLRNDEAEANGVLKPTMSVTRRRALT